MKSKLFSMFVFGIFALAVLASFASANAIITFSGPSFSSNSPNFTITATSVDDNNLLNISSGDQTTGIINGSIVLTSNLTDSSGSSGNNYPPLIPIVDGGSVPTNTLSFNGSSTHTLVYTIPSNFMFQSTGSLASFSISGVISGNLITPTGTKGNMTITPFPIYNFPNQPQNVNVCQFITGKTNPIDNNLQVTLDSPTITSGYGSYTNWYPLDNVTSNVLVQNNGNSSMRSIIVKWALYDEGTKRIILNGQSNSFNLNSGNEKTVAINFKLDNPNIFSNNPGPYILFAWATGNDLQYGGNTTCSEITGNNQVNSIDINRDSDFVVIDSPQIADSASCGGSAQITGTVWNIGDNDENGVYAIISNLQLGLHQRVDIGDISSLNSQDLSFILNVPSDAKEGTYPLLLTVYNNNGEIFKDIINNDDSQSHLTLNINGGCSTVPLASIVASPESAAKAGQELDVKATIVNTDSVSDTFNLGLSGYANWASLISMDQNSVTLAAGASQDVLIKLNVNKGISGDQNFNIILTQGDKTLTQPVKVTVAQESAFSGITGLFSGLNGNGNLYLWGIGALNVILILIIIGVAVKVSKKKE